MFFFVFAMILTVRSNKDVPSCNNTRCRLFTECFFFLCLLWFCLSGVTKMCLRVTILDADCRPSWRRQLRRKNFVFVCFDPNFSAPSNFLNFFCSFWNGFYSNFFYSFWKCFYFNFFYSFWKGFSFQMPW